MISPDELLFSVDEHDKPIDPHPYALSHQSGIWHRTSHVWIVSADDKILCQRRQSPQHANPDQWEPFFEGHLGPHQTYLAGALQEVTEALGPSLQPEQVRFWKVHKCMPESEFQSIYVLQWDDSTVPFQLRHQSTNTIAWHSLETVAQHTDTTHNPNWTQIGYESELFDWIRTGHSASS